MSYAPCLHDAMDPLPQSARMTEPVPIRLLRGTVLGRYAVDGWLREGGMAALYRGHHVETGAKVAIKVQRACEEDDATVAARFAREGEVMGRLSGVPNVVQVHDMGALPDGRRYLVMEWVEGDNLEELLDELRNADSALSIERACRLVADVARALEAAHRARVVHRDLKPSNIMVDRSLGDREVAKLLDFGISADLGAGERGEDLTAAGVVLGTSGYVAPEQALGLPADPAFDVYALGVVLFEAITGRSMPPEGLGPARLPPLRQLRAGAPAELEALVERCMSRDPSQRPASAAAVAETLEAVRAEGAASRSVADARAVEQPGDATTTGASSTGSAVVGVGARAGWSAVVLLGLALAAGAGWWALAPSPGSLAVASGSETAVEETRGALEHGSASGAHAPASRASSGDLTTGSELADGSSGPAATDDGATEEGRSAPALEGGSETGATPSTPRASCRRARSEAEAALGRRDWKAVLRASADRDCWSAAAQRRDRKAMRVKAWLELRRYDRCVSEGAGETDPRVARLTKYCRERVEAGG